MKIYVDAEFKCHTTNSAGTLRELEVDFFNGKCTAFVEGYRYIPAGEAWKRPDGVEFTGEMIAPWRDYTILEAAQAAYEEAHDSYLGSAEAAYQEGVNGI